MDDLPKVLVDLEAQYQERRHAFLDAAFKICWVALNWSAAELDLGNTDLALAEVRNVDNWHTCDRCSRFFWTLR
jgi:hypothetical protein